MDIKKRLEWLVREVNKHNHNYYVLDKPTISDYEYDRLYDELVELEKSSGIILFNSPTQRVGGEILKKFRKYEHKVPLFSLDKRQNFDELRAWIEGIQKEFPKATFCMEYKFDGLSIVIEYNEGVLVSASTRGNGRIGEDVTAQVKTIKSVPLEIPFIDRVIIQGEGMITISNFEKYNRTADEPLKNVRNAAAGAIRNLDPKQTAKRNLDLFAYSVNYIQNKEIRTQKEANDFLMENGFKTSGFFKVFNNADDIIKEIIEVDQQRGSLDLLIDGIVIKVNEIAPREELGYTSKFPKWAVAYKFKPQEISALLRDIVWQVGRTGKITPIGLLEPVELAGAMVGRATLNNMGDIKRKKVKIGARVFVRRSNEVIPEILGLAEDTKTAKIIDPPTHCPSCTGPLVETGANMFCTNVNCPEKISDSLTHFASKEAMNIEGLSDKTIKLLYNKLNLRKLSDIYKLRYEDLIGLEGFKRKKVENLLNAIEKSKEVSLSSFIFALGISNVGTKTAKDLSKYFKSLDRIMKADINELLEIKDIGEIVATSIYNYFRNDKNVLEIKNLFNVGIKIKSQIAYDSEFNGKTIVLTGGLKNYTRLEAIKILEKYGASIGQSVGKTTDLVLVGEDAGSKLDKAKKLGIQIIYEEDFENFIKNNEKKI
jgi:DNA ligase (NAD+)